MSKQMEMREAVRGSESAPVRTDDSYFPALSDKVGWLGFLAAALFSKFFMELLLTLAAIV